MELGVGAIGANHGSFCTAAGCVRSVRECIVLDQGSCAPYRHLSHGRDLSRVLALCHRCTACFAAPWNPCSPLHPLLVCSVTKQYVISFVAKISSANLVPACLAVQQAAFSGNWHMPPGLAAQLHSLALAHAQHCAAWGAACILVKAQHCMHACVWGWATAVTARCG